MRKSTGTQYHSITNPNTASKLQTYFHENLGEEYESDKLDLALPPHLYRFYEQTNEYEVLITYRMVQQQPKL